VQLTHRYNYEAMGAKLGVDLAGNPALALDPDIAARILVVGMRDGDFNGRGHGLSHYVNEQAQDWYQARRTVNVLDHAGEIATNAEEYYTMLNQCETIEAVRGGGGGVGSPIAGVSIDEVLAYQPTAGQDFYAYRKYRDGYHAGIDFDSRIGMGEGGQVASVSSGQISNIVVIAEGDRTGEPSISVRIVTQDSEGRTVEQRYTHLSQTSVEQALGVPINQAIGMQIDAGQSIGVVGEDDSVSSGAHLDYKVKVNGEFVHPMEFLNAVQNGGGALNTLNVGSGARGTTQIGAIGGTSAPETEVAQP
jgi:murein DD-endopeptidase MepM/ murein hydrolase activator NlpD